MGSLPARAGCGTFANGHRCPITGVVVGNPRASRSGGPTKSYALGVASRAESAPQHASQRLRASHARGRWFEPSRAHNTSSPPLTAWLLRSGCAGPKADGSKGVVVAGFSLGAIIGRHPLAPDGSRDLPSRLELIVWRLNARRRPPHPLAASHGEDPRSGRRRPRDPAARVSPVPR